MLLEPAGALVGAEEPSAVVDGVEPLLDLDLKTLNSVLFGVLDGGARGVPSGRGVSTTGSGASSATGLGGITMVVLNRMRSHQLGTLLFHEVSYTPLSSMSRDACGTSAPVDLDVTPDFVVSDLSNGTLARRDSLSDLRGSSMDEATLVVGGASGMRVPVRSDFLTLEALFRTGLLCSKLPLLAPVALREASVDVSPSNAIADADAPLCTSLCLNDAGLPVAGRLAVDLTR